MPSKDTLTKNNNALAVSGLSAKSVTGVSAYIHGDVAVIEVAFSGGSSFFKVKKGQIEVGGTNEWGTGTIQL